jgi:hypothetical protein
MDAAQASTAKATLVSGFFDRPTWTPFRGVVDSTKLIDLQKTAPPEDKIGKRHGWSI